MDAKSCGSMSSCCIGLKAGPAGFPERVRPGAAGCPPCWVSGETVPFSAFAIKCASSCVDVAADWHPGLLGVARVCRFCCPSTMLKESLSGIEGLSFDYAQDNRDS